MAIYNYILLSLKNDRAQVPKSKVEIKISRERL